MKIKKCYHVNAKRVALRRKEVQNSKNNIP